MPLTTHPVARGAALIIAGMAVIGFIDNFVWLIAAEISVWQFHLLRSALVLPALALAAARAHHAHCAFRTRRRT